MLKRKTMSGSIWGISGVVTALAIIVFIFTPTTSSEWLLAAAITSACAVGAALPQLSRRGRKRR